MTYQIEDFLEIRTAAAGSFSPDGSKLIVHSNVPGTMQLYRAALAGGDLLQLTDLHEPVGGAYLPASDELLVTMDEGGNERNQLYLMGDAGGELRKLVYDPEFIHRPGGVTRDGQTLAYASNRRNGTDFDVYIHDLATGEERCVFDLGGWCGGAGFSPDGRLLGVVRLTDKAGDNDVYLVDVHSGEVLYVTPHDDESQFSGPSWLPDGSGFFFASDHGREFSAIWRYDMRARTSEPVIEREWDLSCQIDWPGSKLLVSANEDGYRTLTIYDPATLERRGEVPLPRQGIAGGTFSRDGRRFAYTFISPMDPGDAWVYDFETSETHRITSSPNPVTQDEFVEPELHRFSSFDGEQIPVFLFRPRTPARAPTPVVVSIHGGPESQYVPSFNAVTQYLVHRGYAVVAPNVRGSTGYGKRFEHLDDRRKRLDSVRDLEALHGWIGAVGGLDPTRAVLNGGSYGGYMVLAGLALQPDLWAAGVDIVGISSLVTFLENTSSWRRRFREREYGWLETDREFLIEASPITHVDRMRAPLLIIHGSNDPRVPLGEAEQIHDVLTSKGVPCELLVYPDEGHGLAKLKNRLDAYPKVADFLDRVLA